MKALVTPQILTWARNSAGFTVAEAAEKAHVKVAKLERWEHGEDQPTIRQLRELGRIYRRHIAIFYLPEPPRDFQPLRDYRRFPGRVPPRLSPELIFEVREAHDRRETMIELAKDLQLRPPEFPLSIGSGDDPERAGLRIRDFLGARYEEQGRGSQEQSLHYWRVLLEKQNLLVFQTTMIDRDEIRGFSISEIPFPVIVANRKDFPRPRIFTLLHELAHIALHRGGLCDMDDETGRAPEDQRVEVFCNHVAGAAFVPQDRLLIEPIVRSHPKSPVWTDDEIKALARIYGSSREVLLRRLLHFGMTTQDFYRRKRAQYQAEYLAIIGRRKAGFLPPAPDLVSAAGKPFVRLVLEALGQGVLSIGRTSDYLGIRLKHLPRVRHLVATE
jgi:Zn-dependent peptidase ImmA (M78 family)